MSKRLFSNKNSVRPLAVFFPVLLSACAQEPVQLPHEPVFRSDMDKSSYVQGVRYMENLRQYEIPLNRQAFLQGMDDVLKKAPYRLSSAEMQKGQIWPLIEQDRYMERVGKINLEKGKEFLANNQKAPGVTALPSGLQFQVISRGNGKLKPKQDDAVSVHYEIKRINGEKLTESGKDETAPSLLLVNNLIKGWQEGLQLMKEGDKWRLFIPPHLAYGEAGAPPGGVGSNETLIYDIELLAVKQSMNAKAKQELRNRLSSGISKTIASW